MSAHGIVVAPHHDPLPSLPIPSLDETLDKYLKYTALHLSSEEERAEVRAIVERFRHTDGPQLQAQLLQRSASATTSWLLDWWTQLAYLAYPDSLPIWSNFYCQFNPSSSVPKELSTLVSQPGIPSIQAVRSAIWCVELLRYRDDILTHRLPKSSLCLRLLNNAFNSCRIPVEPVDSIHRLNPEDTRGDFIVVMRDDHFFVLSSLGGGADGAIVDWTALARALQHILDGSWRARAPAKTDEVSWLTAGNRHDWAKMRELLRAGDEPNNSRIMRAIEDCAFVLCLDSEDPGEDVNASDTALFHNRGRNRWFDKPIQLVSFPSGRGGANCEHSGWDGTTAVPIFERMLANERNYLLSSPPYPAERSESGLELVEGPLQFTVPDALREALRAERVKVDGYFALENHATAVCSAYGKELLKTCKLSPDAVCQLAFQVAYQRLFHRSVPVYESASTRRFQWGRTETLRPVSEQSVAFVSALSSGSASRLELRRLLTLSTQEHSRRAQEAAQKARGCDRHLFGLRQIARSSGGPMPEIFTHPSYGKASYWNMSTSNISSDYFEVGWGAVVPDGFGICYCIRDEEIRVKLSAQPNAGATAQVFGQAILDAFHDLSTLFSLSPKM